MKRAQAQQINRSASNCPLIENELLVPSVASVTKYVYSCGHVLTVDI